MRFREQSDEGSIIFSQTLSNGQQINDSLTTYPRFYNTIEDELGYRSNNRCRHKKLSLTGFSTHEVDAAGTVFSPALPSGLVKNLPPEPPTMLDGLAENVQASIEELAGQADLEILPLLFELDDTIASLLVLAKRLSDLQLFARVINTSSNRVQRIIKNPSAQDLRDITEDSYLEAQFAWLPLARDLAALQNLGYKYRELLDKAKDISNGPLLELTGTHRRPLDYVFEKTVSRCGQTSVRYHYTGFTKWTYSIWVNMWFDEIYKAMTEINAFLDAIGFHPDLATVWELIPFSFVVDYFFPIGNFLQSFRTGWRNPQFRVHVRNVSYIADCDIYVSGKDPCFQGSPEVNSRWVYREYRRNLDILPITTNRFAELLQVRLPTTAQMSNLGVLASSQANRR